MYRTMRDRSASEIMPADGAPFLAHPGLRAALLDYCREMSSRDPPDWPVFKLLDQFHRYMVGFMLVHDHVEWRWHGGRPPTLSGLQARGALGPRQTAAVVATLKSARLVRSLPVPGDRRVQLLEPLPQLVREIAQSPLAFLRAADRLSGSEVANAFAASDEAIARLTHASAASVLRGGPVIPFPRVLHFATRDCGYLILCGVMATFYARHLGEPAGSLAHRALAARLQVSPSHVRNVLRHAEACGWFRTDRRGALADIDAGFVDEFERWTCWQMAHFRFLAATLEGIATEAAT
jgi:hypothetical protein